MIAGGANAPARVERVLQWGNGASRRMPFEITITRRFDATHALRLNDGSWEPVHGHEWIVVVTVGAPRLDAMGVVMDFHELEGQVERIVGAMRGRHLNELVAFARRNPSAEHVALHVGERLALPEGVRLVSVQVTEAEHCVATYRSGAEQQDTQAKE
jgi:6-pyruvoyltetrahydropterin/6-carboxytetrahydropterin synthase